MDLTLNNGNLFEVKEVTDDNLIIGLEKTDTGLIPRQITKSDIQSLQPGFAFNKDTKEKMELEETIYSYGDPMYEEKEFEEQYEEKENGDEYPEEQEEDESIVDEISERDIEEEQEYKESFKDIERITFEGKQLTKEQQKIKTKIEKITNVFGITDLNVFKLIEQVEESIITIKKQLRNANMNFWNISDEKYIIASIVLFDIIKSGLVSMIVNFGNDTLTAYITELSTGSRAFFNKKDYANSIFMKAGWSNEFEVDDKIFETLVNAKEQIEIHKFIMTKCIAVLESFYGKINLEIKNKKPEELTLLGKRKYEDEPRTRITLKDIFRNNVTSDATTILWGLAYQPLLEKYKSKLISKINDPNSNKTTKLVYDYVLQNLERGLFATKEIQELSETSKSPLDLLKYEKMSKIWDNLLSDAEIIYKKLQKEKQKKIKEITKQREELMTKRETISATKRLKSFGLKDEEEESVELDYKRKYPSYLERMAKKRGL